MTERRKIYRVAVLDAIILAGITFAVGAGIGKNKVETRLSQEIVQDKVVIVDESLAKRAEISDLDGDREYDCLQIYSTSMPSRYTNKAVDIYVKSGLGYIAQPLGEQTQLHIVDADEFNNWVNRNNIPKPRDSLLNRSKSNNNLPLYRSYSALFNPDLKDVREKK